jgi:AAHS family 4-hydroxybenzoate transporter-like MFS transporter
MKSMKTIDVGSVLDKGEWSGYQKLLIVGTALAIILDGIDNQLLGNAVPTLMEDWDLPRTAFTTPLGGVLALSPLGMMFGGAIGGMLGDRIGRRTTLIFCVIAFAIFTLGIAGVGTVPMLGVLRFLAGLGLGGAMPNAAALASEYVPARTRPFAVTMTIVCIPLGGTIAGYLSGWVLPRFGWRVLFLLGGIIPIVLALILLKVLPESPRFMARHRERWPALIQLLRKLGHNVPDDVTFSEIGSGPQTQNKAIISDLFKGGFARDTIGLFGAFFFGLLGNYVAIFLLVATLTGTGFSQGDASNALGNWNLGGVIGAILGALVIQQFGSRVTMLGMSVLAIICALGLASMQIGPQNAGLLTVMFILTGGLLNAVQTTMYALAANVYPTQIRGTGIGTALAVGRVGNVLASFVGNFALEKGGVPGYFMTFAITMAIVFVSLLVVRSHVVPSGSPVVASSH